MMGDQATYRHLIFHPPPNDEPLTTPSDKPSSTARAIRLARQRYNAMEKVSEIRRSPMLETSGLTEDEEFYDALEEFTTPNECLKPVSRRGSRRVLIIAPNYEHTESDNNYLQDFDLESCNRAPTASSFRGAPASPQLMQAPSRRRPITAYTSPAGSEHSQKEFNSRILWRSFCGVPFRGVDTPGTMDPNHSSAQSIKETQASLSLNSRSGADLQMNGKQSNSSFGRLEKYGRTTRGSGTSSPAERLVCSEYSDTPNCMPTNTSQAERETPLETSALQLMREHLFKCVFRERTQRRCLEASMASLRQEVDRLEESYEDDGGVGRDSPLVFALHGHYGAPRNFNPPPISRRLSCEDTGQKKTGVREAELKCTPSQTPHGVHQIDFGGFISNMNNPKDPYPAGLDKRCEAVAGKKSREGGMSQTRSLYSENFNPISHLEYTTLPSAASNILSDSPIIPVAGGRFSDVYLGTWGSETQLAVKCLRTCSSDDTVKIYRRVVRESLTWAKLDHSNVLKLYGIGLFDGKLALVSPWMSNGTLHEYIRQKPGVDRWHLCQQIASGLEYLHENQVVHGELKASNVLVSEEGTAKLTDFGKMSVLEQLFTSSPTSFDAEAARWKAKPAETKSGDIYALGMTVLETVTARKPFYEYKSNPYVAIAIVQGAHPKRPNEFGVNTYLGDERWNLLLKCWAFESSSRPTASEVTEMMKSELRF
ncbi:Ephrin type-A receptor 7 [Ceratobasidium sp. AG-Ba]|nr:Ephrin type-A receptor 7 [Ceratobasidium sp. AG-Ba]